MWGARRSATGRAGSPSKSTIQTRPSRSSSWPRCRSPWIRASGGAGAAASPARAAASSGAAARSSAAASGGRSAGARSASAAAAASQAATSAGVAVSPAAASTRCRPATAAPAAAPRRGARRVAGRQHPVELQLGERPAVDGAGDVVLRQQQPRLAAPGDRERRGAVHRRDAGSAGRRQLARQLDLGVHAPREPAVALEREPLAEHQRRV